DHFPDSHFGFVGRVSAAPPGKLARSTPIPSYSTDRYSTAVPVRRRPRSPSSGWSAPDAAADTPRAPCPATPHGGASRSAPFPPRFARRGSSENRPSNRAFPPGRQTPRHAGGQTADGYAYPPAFPL